MTASLPKSGAPLEHYVSTAPFDPMSVEAMTAAQSKIYQASQLRLMWWKFKRHRLAVVSLFFLAALYAMITIVEFLAPYNLHTRNVDYIHSPPQRVHLFNEGSFVGPFVYGRTMKLDMDTLRRIYTEDKSKVEKLRFFCSGDPYKFWVWYPPASTSSARQRMANSSFSAPTGSAATCCRASFTAPASRSPSASWA